MLVAPRSPKEPSPDLTSMERGAEFLDCSVKTMRRLIQAGELTGYRVGKKMLRVDLNEVRALAKPIATTSRVA